MIKEILEYGDGPAPIPRMPLSQYPMGMVPGIHDQISDHLKRNWLWYLLGGGALLGPGLKKINAFNSANAKFQRHMNDNAQLHQLLDAGKHEDILRAHGIDPTIGSAAEKKAKAEQLVADHDARGSNLAIDVQNKHEAASNSFANNLPFIGGVKDPFQGNGLNFGPGYSGSGLNFDAIQAENNKQYSKQYKLAQKKVSAEAESFLRANPNAKESEIRRHLMNSANLKNDPDINHDMFADTDHDLEHFVDDHMDYRRRQNEKDQIYDQQQQQAQQQQDASPDQTGLNGIKNAKTDEDKYNKLKDFMHNGDANSDQDHIANAHQHMQTLNDWENKFNLANQTSSPLDTIKQFAPQALKDFANIKDPEKISMHDQTVMAGKGALEYLNNFTGQGNAYGVNNSVDDLNAKFLRRQDKNGNDIQKADGSYAELDLNNDNDRAIYRQRVRNHISDRLADIYGVDKDHFNHIFNGGQSYSDYQAQNPQNQSQQQNQNNTGSTGSSGGSPTPNHDDEFNKMWNHNNLSDNDRNRISSMWGWDNKLDHKADQNYLNAASNLIYNNRTANPFYANGTQGTLNDVAKMIKAAHSGGLATDIQGASNLVQNHIDKFNNPSQQSGQNQQQPTWSDVKNGFNNNMQQRSVNIINTKLGTQNNSTPFNIQNHGQALSKQVIPESNSNINDIIKSYLFNEDSDEFGRSSGRIIDDEGGFLKKHWGKILAGLAAGSLGVVRNHLKANAHEDNAEYFYSKGNRSLGDDELAKAHVKRSIDPIYKVKNMYHSMRDRFGK